MKLRRILSIALLCLFAPIGNAQTSAGGGSIQGTVKDSSGAAIPAAKINILHVDTGRATNTVSNGDGYFTTPSLPIGRYRVRVESPGMKTWEDNLGLETGRSVDIKPLLVPGQVTEVIQVTEAAPLVTTTDPTDATTLDSKRIRELPVNGRSLNTLLADVTPGVEEVIDVNGGVRTGGLMVYSTSFTQDGASSNNREFGGSMNLQGLESIGEVRVETSTASAKSNTPTTVSVTTKSGTNKLRFGAHETARNNAFGVAKARQDVSFTATPYQVPKLIRNEFGGYVSGPVVLPKIYNGRNKTFFLFSREGVELRQGLTRDFSVPTAAMRNGDFSNLFDSSNRFLQLYDPQTTRTAFVNGKEVATRDPFLNNQIPANRINPLAKAVWGITPIPSDITNPVITTNLKLAVPTNGFPNLSDNPTTIKVDHRINERDNFYIKTNGGRRKTNFIGTAAGIGVPTTNKEANVTFLPMQAIAGAIGWTHIFSPRLFMENLVSHTWQSTKTITGPADAQKDFASAFGLPNPYGEIGFPNLTSIGNLVTYTEGDNRRALTSKILNAQQNYTFIQRTHNIQFGWALYKENQHLLPDQGAISGSAAFNSQATALMSPTLGSITQAQAVPQTGYDAANFYLGAAGTYTVGLKRSYLRLQNQNLGMYLQDTYKVNSRLTLFPGIRWDVNPAMKEDNDQLNSFDKDSHSLLLPQPLSYYYKAGITTPAVVKVYEAVGYKFSSAEQLNKSKDIFPNNYFDIGPRMGFAYTAFQGSRQMVIRGGYGMYISGIPMRTLLAQFSAMPPFRGTFQYNPNSAATSPDGYQNWLLRNQPKYIAGVNSAGAVDLNSPNSIGVGSVGVVGIDPKFPNLRIHEWNLLLEKQIANSMVFRIRYNGKHGVNADQLNEINALPSNYIRYITTLSPLPTGTLANVTGRPYDSTSYQSVRFLSKTGRINTETFTLETERRFSKGLGFQLFYTLTNALRLAGNSFRDGIGTQPSQYLPGTVPTDPEALNKFLNYTRDTGVPKHRVRWNFSYELPFGKGRKFASTSNKFLNGMIGGWQLAGTGTVVSSWWAISATNWGPVGDIQVNGKKYQILDCRATSANATNPKEERCYSGYLYYNGYITQRLINSKNAAGLKTGVFGLPADYKPFTTPINPWPVGGATTDPGSTLYDTNNVNIRLNNGTTVQAAYDTGLNPMRNQFRLGPFNWTQDASMQKTFAVTERLKLRANFDVFNVFNVQGLNTPGADGIVTLQNSYGGFGIRPRQVQVALRMDW